MTGGIAAYQQGDYAEAEAQIEAGLKEAERFGLVNPRLGTSLNNLAALTRPKASIPRYNRFMSAPWRLRRKP